jgi:hypothetical protein
MKGQSMTTPRKDFRIVRERFARDSGLPFGRLLTRDYVLSVLESEGHYYKSRIFCPLVTLWAWLSQCLSQDKSLNEAVARIVANRVVCELPACSASSAAYSKARTRFPLEVMERMAKEVGRNIHERRSDEWNWRGRPVFLADGTAFSMPDTIENQLAYPQVATVKKGLGFPIMRAVGLISLSTGTVVDMAFAKHVGKGTGESSLLREIMDSMPRGSVLVADKYYPSYYTVAALLERGIDLVSVSHAGRPVNFNEGKVLGPKDHIATWHKPKWRTGIDRAMYDRLPDTIQVREFEIEIESRNGGKEKAVVVTTIIDETVPQKEISDLYWARWNCELDIRSIKHSLHMDVLRCKTPEMILKEIWAHMLAWNLLRGVIVESAKRHDAMPRQLSVKGAMQAVESFTPAMMSIDGNEEIYHAMLATVSAHRVADRPGRLEPRFKKRRPVWPHYMTIPRSESKRRLAAAGKSSPPLA